MRRIANGVPGGPEQDDEFDATISTVADYLPGPSSTLSEWHKKCVSSEFDIFGALMNLHYLFCCPIEATVENKPY